MAEEIKKEKEIIEKPKRRVKRKAVPKKKEKIFIGHHPVSGEKVYKEI